MIWEEDPLPAVAERLRGMGIEPVAFETCAMRRPRAIISVP